MSTWKKALLAVAGVVLLVVAALAAVPYLFRGQIDARVRAGINEGVDANVDYGSVGLTFFRNFPNLTFAVGDLAVTGAGVFEGDTLAHVGDLALVIDLRSAIGAYRRGDPLVIRSIDVHRPYFHIRVLEDGIASWDILKAMDQAGDAAVQGSDGPVREDAPFHIALRRFAIREGRVALDDAESGLYVRAHGVDHTLSGDFTRERFALTTSTAADTLTVHHLGVPYLNGVRLEAVAEIAADMANRRFAFRDNRLALNDLGVAFGGQLALLDDTGMELDLTFAADRAEFREVLSLIPTLYLQDFESLDASGDVDVAGHVRGRYSADAFPSFRIDVDVADGAFKYSDLPLPARGIALDLVVANPGGDPDSTYIDLSRLDITIGDDAFHARAGIRTPISDPAIDVTAQGRVDLGAVARTIKLEGIDELRGVITTDASLATRLSYLDAGDYDRVDATGTVTVEGMAVRGPELPRPVEIAGMRLELSPSRVALHDLDARVGSSDFRGTGELDNLLGFALRDEELRGRATLSSRYMDLDEWQSEDEEVEVIPVPANLHLTLEAAIDRLRLGELEMENARGTVQVADQRVTVDGFELRALGGDVVMSGFYETTDLERPTFDFDLGLRGIDIAGAFRTLNTVRALAPAAAYASGRFSGDLRLSGPLGQDLVPVFEVLDGLGTLTTAGVAIRGMPVMNRLADALDIDRLRDPGLSDFSSSLAIRDGRMHVHPFDVRVAGSRVNVAGSNGIDHTLDYRLLLEVPRSELGTGANQLVSGILTEASRRGLELTAADSMRLHVVVGGTMTQPTVGVDLADVAASASASAAAARDMAEARLREEADRRTRELQDRADELERSAAEAGDLVRDSARARANQAADQILAEAEEQATRIREESERLAASVRREGDAQADRLLDEATTPLARRAATSAGDRIRREAESRAAEIIEAGDVRAERLLAAARERAATIRDP